MSSRFPGCDALDASIPILWRCFHFHACYPYPKTPSQRLNYTAFKRAVALLSSDGSEHLGTDAMGADAYYELKLDPDVHTYLRLWKMFRSLAVQSTGTVVPDTAVYEEARESEMDDLIDVLALIQPADVNIMSLRREKMRPLVNRILGSSEPHVHTSIPRGELFSLLKLFLSFQVDKPEQDNDIAHVNGVRDRLAKAVLRCFTLDEESDIDFQSFKQAISI